MKHLKQCSLLLVCFLVLSLFTACADKEQPAELQPGITNSSIAEESAQQDYSQQSDSQNSSPLESESQENTSQLSEDGTYTEPQQVAEYLNRYGHLPSNFITKKEAKALGWVSREGNLQEVAPGKSIGGDYFGNFEGNLPEAEGRDYHECDVNYQGGHRGAERLVYSNDGLIYYTADHYETFTLLYGGD